MRHSIATVSLSGTLPEKLAAIAAARFDGVEIFESDLVFFNGRPQDVRRIVADHGLTMDLFQPFRDFEAVSPTQFLRNLDRAERKFDVMGELGATLMLVCSNVSPETIDDAALAADQLRQLATRAATRGIRIGYEALSWGARTKSFAQAWSIIDMAAHSSLGLIVDSFHTLVLPDEWSTLKNLPGEKIFFVQLADAPKLGMNPLMLSRHFRCLPGQGELDVPAFVSAVLATGYAGTLSLEIFNDDMRAAPPRQTALDGMRSLQYVEEQVRRGHEAAAQASGQPMPRHRVPLFDPPPEPVLAGIDFLEFALDESSAMRLAALLISLGFRHIGQHRSKHVALYGLGAVRCVLNMEREGFAHSYFLMHGPSVCAMALRCDDAIAAASRAMSYGCQRYEGRVGPNEAAMAAIRVPDGGLIYLTDMPADGHAAFESDFDMAPLAPDGGDFCIDHVAQALPDGQLDSWVLFYRAVLGLKPENALVLSDPYGLVHARAVSNASRSLRFPLSLSESRKTATARSVTTYAGAGVSHIALATGDIFAAARQMRALNVEILPIPPNYYDDLLARFDLEPEFVQKLAEFNVLFDRLDDASFLHFYTMPFEDRFFFEIVQRINRYDLYGAPNAPVRMAAMAHARPDDLLQILR